MQSIVNKTTRKQVKYLQFENDEESDDQEPVDEHKLKMMEGGFTIVEAGDDHLHSKKSKVSDGKSTTMLGIKREHAEQIYKQALEKGKYVVGSENQEEDELQIKKRQKTAHVSLYGLDAKEKKKQELAKLREDFEGYKKIIAKMHKKEHNWN